MCLSWSQSDGMVFIKWSCMFTVTEFNSPDVQYVCFHLAFGHQIKYYSKNTKTVFIFHPSTFSGSVTSGCSSSSLEMMMLALEAGLVGILEGLASSSGLLDSSSSELRLWSLMLSAISFSFCRSCCSSKSASSHWGRGELLFGVGGAWRNRAESKWLKWWFKVLNAEWGKIGLINTNHS